MARKQPTETTSRKNRSPIPALFSTAISAFLVGAMIVGIAAIHSRASAERPPEPNPPVAVNTGAINPQSAYMIHERFVGLLEPARQTQLSFELSGLVTEIYHDEGDAVAAGAIIARLDTAKLISQRRVLHANLKALEADHGLAMATLKRIRTLKRKGWQSTQKFDEARFKAEQVAASLQRARAAIASIEIDIAKSELRAPYAGTVTSRHIDEGTVIAPGAPVMVLMENGSRRVRVGVSVEASRSIEFGKTYQLVTSGKKITGKLISTKPDLQAGTRTVIALFEVTGADDVPFGELIELFIGRSIGAPGAWLPVAALSEGPKGLWTVLTVTSTADGIASVAREAVEVLHVEGDRAYVQGNLSADSRIVTDGTNRVIPGQKVALANNFDR